MLTENEEFITTFEEIGDSFNLSDQLVNDIERFVCRLFGDKNDINSVNDLRYILFKKGQYAEEHLPPTRDVLLNHLRRSNYQAFIWKHFFTNNLHMPSFENHGWLIEDEILVVEWITDEIAPDNILNFISCKCNTGCANRRCSCVKDGLKCTDLCNCKDCSNNKPTRDEEIEDKEDEDVYKDEQLDTDSEYDSEDISEDDSDGDFKKF